MLPLWAISVQRRSSNSAARAAAIALNIFGLLTGLLFLILRSNSKNMAFRPAAASWEQKQEWRLFGSPDIDIGKHLTDPVSLGRRGTLHEVVFPSSEKGQSGVQTSTLRAPSDAATDKETRPMLSSPPYRTPPKQVIAKPPLTSPPSYRAPPIPSVNDPQLVSPPTFQVPPQKPPSEALTQSINHASYTLFPHPAASTPSIAVNQVQSIERKPLDPGAPLGFGRHKFDTSDVTAATVQIGMRLSTGAIEPQMQEHIARSATYPLIISSSKPRPLNEVPQLKQRPLEGVMKPSLGPPIELGSRSRDSTPHEILFRLTSNEELSPEPVKTVALGGPKALDLISPTRGIALWRKFRDERMKSLPPVPVTPSQLQPPAGMRVSFSETRTPATEHGTLRSSQERTALSLALREDEEWPLQGVDMVLPDKSYTPNANRSWI